MVLNKKLQLDTQVLGRIQGGFAPILGEMGLQGNVTCVTCVL
jgi:hypothetical protein